MAKQLFNQPSPLETRIVSRNFAIEGSETLDVYLKNDGYKAFLKAKEMTPTPAAKPSILSIRL